jgi:bifunctional non-homologous end joining protein LigD
VPGYQRGEGGPLLEATRQQGIEGIVAKRLDCRYDPGRRASGWIKVKNVALQDVVIGGWTPGEGGRRNTLGALAVGVMEDGALRYAGKVGTGFTDETLRVVQRELEPLETDASPFDGRQPPKGTRFVEPRLVAAVEFREWTRSGTLRAPSFKGLRPDKDPAEAVREPQVPARP